MHSPCDPAHLQERQLAIKVGLGRSMPQVLFSNIASKKVPQYCTRPVTLPTSRSTSLSTMDMHCLDGW